LTGHVARMGEVKNVQKILVLKREGKRPVRKPRRRWKYNIRVAPKGTGCECMYWTHVAEDRDQCFSQLQISVSKPPCCTVVPYIVSY